ncbi:MAG: NfeD family protein [Endomicrobium sp.]|jgi:membrane protein implicated in regulation of membrane protease activity|nr:NfeD family protein [Endomicrobium sp.]
MNWTIWCAIATLFAIFEILITSTFFFVCFTIGSIISAIASFFVSSLTIEVIIFTTGSMISMSLIKMVSKKITNNSKRINSNVDALIETEAIVTERITPLKTGFVKTSGELWRAKSDSEIEVGEIVKIKNITGTTLIVKNN